MDAHKLWMLRDFIGTNKVLFRIPVYQRNYDWSESNCNRLLDDIYGIMQSGGFALQEYIIIDGQQRLTTLMLILKALSVVAERVGDDCYHEIEEQYLHNKYCSEEFKVKLKPIKSDNNQFTLLLEGKIDEMDEDTRHGRKFCVSDFRQNFLPCLRRCGGFYIPLAPPVVQHSFGHRPPLCRAKSCANRASFAPIGNPEVKESAIP